MDTIQKTLTSDWNFMRFVRLVIGLAIVFNGFQAGNGMIGLLGGLFIFQALCNTGCCGARGCAIQNQDSKSSKTEDIIFKEINSPK